MKKKYEHDFKVDIRGGETLDIPFSIQTKIPSVTIK